MRMRTGSSRRNRKRGFFLGVRGAALSGAGWDFVSTRSPETSRTNDPPVGVDDGDGVSTRSSGVFAPQ
jgi:hypothetical protein